MSQKGTQSAGVGGMRGSWASRAGRGGWRGVARAAPSAGSPARPAHEPLAAAPAAAAAAAGPPPIPPRTSFPAPNPLQLAARSGVESVASSCLDADPAANTHQAPPCRPPGWPRTPAHHATARGCSWPRSRSGSIRGLGWVEAAQVFAGPRSRVFRQCRCSALAPALSGRAPALNQHFRRFPII